jgi:hypothetical protein
MTDTPAEELQHFVSKWYAREPEMQFAEVFVQASDKFLFHVWGALLHEIKHTLFELSDAHVTEIKTAWWADEFQRLSNGQPRHPITQTLINVEAPWASLSPNLLAVTETASRRASNTEQAIAYLLPLSEAIIKIEDALFAAKKPGSKEIFAIHCLLQRLPQGLASEDQARIPMHLMARHSVNASQLAKIGQNGLLQDWASELKGMLDKQVSTSLFRRTRTRFDQAQLANLMVGKGFVKASALKHLWRAWRAAVVQPR